MAPQARVGVEQRFLDFFVRNGHVVVPGSSLIPDNDPTLMNSNVWTAAGKPGKPRFVAGMYYALGPDAAARAGDYLRHYYAFMGPMAETIASSVPTSLEALRGAIAAFAEVGVDELVLWPCTPDLDQIDRLAGLVG